MFRDLKRAWLAGVCSGLAKRLDLPPALVRIVFFLLAWFGLFGVVVYVALWICCKAEPNVDV